MVKLSRDPKGLRAVHRTETRAILLGAALEEIEEHGLLGAKMGDIALRAGVSRATLYAHYPQKENFLEDLQLRAHTRAGELLAERAPEGDLVVLAHEVVDVAFDVTMDERPRVRREYYSWLVREPRDFDLLADPLVGLLARAVEDAQKRGDISKRRKARDLTRLLATALFGFIAVANRPESECRRDAHDTIEMLIDSQR